MKNSILCSLLFASGVVPTYASGNAEIARNDPAIPMQKVESTGPAMTGVRVEIQGKIYLLLLNSADAHLFPKSLAQNIGNTQEKIRLALQKMVSSKKIPAGTFGDIKAYGTTTAVDIGDGKVGFLTASHVLRTQKTLNDVCITNQVIGDNTPKRGVPILDIPSQALNNKHSYTQFPFYGEGKFMMVQMPSVLRYRNMGQWIEGRFDKFVGGASGAPVISENPTKKGEYGIVSIFPGGVRNDSGSMNIAQMPRNEVLQEVKKLALEASKKGGDYAICR